MVIFHSYVSLPEDILDITYKPGIIYDRLMISPLRQLSLAAKLSRNFQDSGLDGRKKIKFQSEVFQTWELCQLS